MPAEILTLFRVCFFAATAPARPTFWADQSGYCIIFVFAVDSDDAGKRAQAIVENLPFVIDDLEYTAIDCGAPALSVVEDDQDARTRREMLKRMEAIARKTGFCFAFAPRGEFPRVADGIVIQFAKPPDVK